MSGPLEGIRVIELGQMIAVPAAAHVLAGQGASVIKVEDTRRGDELRFYGSQKNGISAWFISANGGKRSIGVDLQEARGKEILWQLLDGADVFMQGFRPGVLDRLGFSPDTARRRCRQLIYYSSSGFGADGPYANQPAYDPIIQALSGWAGSQTNDGEPSLIRGMVADKVAAMMGAQAITAALVQRGRTGVGQHVDLSMLEANIAFNWSDVMMHCSLLDADAEHRPNVLASYRLLRCRDGWVTVAAGNDAQWQGFCRALERPDIARDERFATPIARGSNLPAWYDTMDEMVISFDADDVLKRVRAEDVPAAPVLNPDQVADDPQVVARQGVTEINHPVAGRLLQPRPGARFEGHQFNLSAAPLHGEHTDGLLAELGYEAAAIRTLRNDGVVV
jgi:crotonobetainyl-CoA:carnitine CoA-transferase CaiB-like acyl-CoA transferase